MRFRMGISALQVGTCILVLGCGVLSGLAAEDRLPSPTAGTNLDTKQEEPAVYFQTEGDFFVGYRWVSTQDSLKAAEYVDPHSSVSLGLDLLSCPLPWRYHANAELVSKHDFYADAGFAFKDTVLFRNILVGVHHNLEHFSYPPDQEPPDLFYDERNTEDLYSVDWVSNLLSLRLKAPEFPFHTFVNHRHIERDSAVQQRFLLGNFNELNKISESRQVDWHSDAVTLGTNSHLGPIEIEYDFDWSEFNPGPDNILYDPDPILQHTVSHNVVPETESHGHTVKLHSSYTGGIVTAATLGNLTQKNNYSLTESSTWKGAFDFSWIPDPVAGLFFKYRRTDVDMDTPDIVSFSGHPTIYPVRQGVSYTKDLFSLSSRYKPLSFLSLFATYEFSHLQREETDVWIVLPAKTDIHTIDLTARVKPLDRLRLTANYKFKHYNQPAYNTSPDLSNTLRLTSTYTPTATVNLYLEYTLALTERDKLRYLNNSTPAVLIEEGCRDGQHDQFLVSLTKSLTPTLSITGSWFYQRGRLEQDLRYGKWLGASGDPEPYRDADVTSTDKASSFALSMQYMPRNDITVTADATHTITKGTTGYNDVVGSAPFSLDSFSNLKAAETSLSFDIAKKLYKVWQVGLRSYINIYDDREADLLDGKVFVSTFTIKRYF